MEKSTIIKDHKADYYFGPEKKIIERAEDENEFEVSITDEKDMMKIGTINDIVSSSFWRDIWMQLAFSGSKYEIIEQTNQNYFDEDSVHRYINIWEVPETAMNKHPYSFPQIWTENTSGANNKGWDWSGDTDVYVHELSGPSNLKEVSWI